MGLDLGLDSGSCWVDVHVDESADLWIDDG